VTRSAAVPPARLRALNSEPVRAERDFVLYWMVAARRTHQSFALDRAVEAARALDKPLVVLEALRAGHPWASERFHGFVLQGMADNAARFAAARVAYHPYVEPAPGDGRGLLETLAKHAALVISDDSPTFFLPRMLAAAARRCEVRFEVVDGYGLLPLCAHSRAWSRAVDFRRHLQQQLPHHFGLPEPDPLAGARALRPLPLLPSQVTSRWPAASHDLLALAPAALGALVIDHRVGRSRLAGGARAGQARLRAFIDAGLTSYAEESRHPDSGAASGLSAHLHFGQLGAHEIFDAVSAHEGWSPGAVGPRAAGQKQHWWGMSESAEAFLDQLVTWRELGAGSVMFGPDVTAYESLPEWARNTLERHAGDPRPHRYTRRQLEQAETHDPIWNAAQRQLVTEGSMPGYLRMLWGKKVLEWSAHPREALHTLIELNDRFALDGRDPNSYSGIGWCFGRYDRPWAPERPIFGRVRYMSSEATRRKLRHKAWLGRWSEAEQQSLGL
jgi:deoxyribodipyrimidine photo-lyase